MAREMPEIPGALNHKQWRGLRRSAVKQRANVASGSAGTRMTGRRVVRHYFEVAYENRGGEENVSGVRQHFFTSLTRRVSFNHTVSRRCECGGVTRFLSVAFLPLLADHPHTSAGVLAQCECEIAGDPVAFAVVGGDNA